MHDLKIYYKDNFSIRKGFSWAPRESLSQGETSSCAVLPAVVLYDFQRRNQTGHPHPLRGQVGTSQSGDQSDQQPPSTTQPSPARLCSPWAQSSSVLAVVGRVTYRVFLTRVRHSNQAMLVFSAKCLLLTAGVVLSLDTAADVSIEGDSPYQYFWLVLRKSLLDIDYTGRALLEASLQTTTFY